MKNRIAFMMIAFAVVLLQSCDEKEEVSLAGERNVTVSELESGTKTYYYEFGTSNKTYYIAFNNGYFRYGLLRGNDWDYVLSGTYSISGDKLTLKKSYINYTDTYCLKILWVTSKSGKTQLYLFKYPDSTGSIPSKFQEGYYDRSIINLMD